MRRCVGAHPLSPARTLRDRAVPVKAQQARAMAVATGVALALTLTACGGKPTTPANNSASPTAASTATSTPLPTSTPTVKPTRHFEAVGSLPVGLDSATMSLANGMVRATTRGGTLLTSHTYTDISEFDISCGILTPPSSNGNAKSYTLRRQTFPAAGLQPEKTVVYITAWHTATLTKAWDTEIGPISSTSYGCAGLAADGRQAIGATTDGKWLTVTGGIDGPSALVNAETGALRFLDFYPIPLGVNIGTFSGECANCFNGLDEVKILNPKDLTPVSDLTGRGTGFTTPLDVLVASVAEPGRAAWSADSTRVAVARSGAVKILNISTGQITATMPLGPGPETVYGFPMLDESNNLLLVMEAGFNATDTLHAYAFSTGAELWKQVGITRACYAANNEVVVTANAQLVLLDARTGKQTDFTATLTDCGNRIGNYANIGGTWYQLTDAS